MKSPAIKTIAKHKMILYFPKRLIVVILGFVGVLMNSVIRGTMSVAMVVMVNHRNSSESYSASECPVAELHAVNNATAQDVFVSERYDWDPISQGNILSAYFYCYFVTVLTGGCLAQRYGAARVFGGGVLLASLLCFGVPMAAASGGGIIPLIVMRSFQGLCLGGSLPSMSAVVSRWSPKLERSLITTVIFTGTLMSTVTANPISAWLTTLDFLGGWPAIFYISGLCGCIWCAFWFSLVYESPREHPTITPEELLHFSDETPPSKRHAVPWKGIATSLPFWSVLLAQCASVFNFNILMIELPTYLATVLHFNIKATGALSTLPFLAESVGGWTSSFAADRMRGSSRWSITTIRKFFNSVAGYALCGCLVCIPFSGCDSSLILGLLTFGMFIDGFKFSGFHATTIDMSTEFAGTLYSLEYGASSIFGIAGPQMVGILTASGATVKNWSKVFYITAAIKFVATTFYAVFASSEPQMWGTASNKDGEDRSKEIRQN